MLAPFGGADEMVRDFKVKVFPKREVAFLSTEASCPAPTSADVGPIKIVRRV